MVDIEVRCGEELVSGPEISKARAASPDVQAAHPDLIDAGNARFYVTIAPAEDGRPRWSDCLVTITPLFADGSRGVPLANLLTPRIPLPKDEAIESVGGGMDVAFKVFVDLVLRADLRREHRVLDVGCGIGRMAYPLAYYLSSIGSYEGFDIMRDAIAWAEHAFSKHCPSFRFRHVDLFNTRYNKSGRLKSDSFAFPYEGASFDRLFLNSVFTHMVEGEVLHYLDEFARVLRRGGKAYVTCFVLDAESERLIGLGKSSQNLVHPLGVAKVANPDVPEESIGFPEGWLLPEIERRGFAVERRLRGSWCGRSEWVGYQDALVLARS